MNQEKIRELEEAIESEARKPRPNYDTINILIGVIRQLKNIE